MARPNRITPFGEFEGIPARGLFMGNRGILHDDRGTLGSARWRHKNWIVCTLSCQGRKAVINAPGHYTKLFFCDEPTALAAGHRPCAECRRPDFLRYMMAWQKAYGLKCPPKAGEADEALHQARVGPDRQQVRTLRRIGNLPDGTMVTLDKEPEVAWLIWKDGLHRWSHSGYTEHRPIARQDAVVTLTPEPTIQILAAGYSPLVHPTADRSRTLFL